MWFRGPHSFNHLLVIAAVPRKGRAEEAKAHSPNLSTLDKSRAGRGSAFGSRSCDKPNIVTLGPEFCEPPDLDQDLHYVVRYIDPENLLSVVSHPFCSYLK